MREAEQIEERSVVMRERHYPYYYMQVRRLRPALMVVMSCLLIALPFELPIIGADSELNFVTGLFIWGILALSLDIVWGYGGLISLAQGVFFGLGAYSMAYVLTHYKGSSAIIIAIVAGVTMAPALAVVLGYISFRSQVGGLFFAVITLALALAAQLGAVTWKSVTGGENGIYGIPNPFVNSANANADVIQYYLVLVFTLAIFAFTRQVVRSHFGRALTAIRENEIRARSVGIDVERTKTIAFGIGALVASLGGAIFAIYNGIVTPPLVGFDTGTNAFIWVAIGGRGSLLGACLGVFVVEQVRFSLTQAFGTLVSFQQAPPLLQTLFGIIFLIVILRFPAGLVGSIARLGPMSVPLHPRLAVSIRGLPVIGPIVQSEEGPVPGVDAARAGASISEEA